VLAVSDVPVEGERLEGRCVMPDVVVPFRPRDALVGFIRSGKLEFQSLADSILADLARITVRQTLTAPLACALQSAFAGGGLFGLFHEGGIAGERPAAMRYADAAVFEHAPRYHSGGFSGSDLLPDEVPIIARRGELVVPPERVVREEKTAREQRPITVVVNVTAADASSFRASQGQSAADGARDRSGEPQSIASQHLKHIESRRGGGGAAGQGMGASRETRCPRGWFWPAPLIQLNPSFVPGATVQELVRERVLHEAGRSYVLTTGTGSGKSLSYFIPIVDRALRHGKG
jgi:hypothetical protein